MLRSRGTSPERVLAARLQRKAGQGTGVDLPLPVVKTYMGRELPVRLSIETSQRAQIGGLVFVTLFWNGIVGVFIVVGLTTEQFPFWVWLFLTPFVLVGIGIFAALIRQILVVLRVPDTVVEIYQEPVCPGETIRILVSQGGNLDIESLQMDVVCEEKIRYTRGTDTYHENRKIWSDTLLQSPAFTTAKSRPWKQSVDLAVPIGAMHSFHASNNQIVWKVVVKGAIAHWPDFEFAFPFRVMPDSARRRMSWKRESLSA